LHATVAMPANDASAWIGRWIKADQDAVAAKRIRPPDGGLTYQTRKTRDQSTGFQVAGIKRYFVPSFSTWPIEGKAKWKPTTVAFSAAAIS
jgi:hypothetical protein